MRESAVWPSRLAVKWGARIEDRPRLLLFRLERKPGPELNLALRECRRKGQWCARANRVPVGQHGARSEAVHVKRRVACLASARDRADRRGGPDTEKRGHLIVNAGKGGVVRDVESLRRKGERSLFPDLVSPAQAHIEINERGSETGVTRRTERTLIGDVIVAVDFAAHEQVERQATVIGENGRELKSGQDRILPRTVEHSGDYDLVALVKFGETSIQARLSRILRRIVGVEVRGGVEAFAEGVVSKHGEVIAEAFLRVHNQALVQGRGGRSVLVILGKQWVDEASEGIWSARQAFDAAQRSGGR